MAQIQALFVNHRGQRCGVYQFGARFHAALATDPRIRWHYVECADRDEFTRAVAERRPDLVVLNHHPFTLAWAEAPFDLPDIMVCAVLHEVSARALADVDASPFDMLLCVDPTLRPRHPRVLAGPRFIPTPLPDATRDPDVFTVGSFGFATAGKGFERLCELVNEQFDVARIRINMPPHDSEAMVSTESRARIIEGCRAAVTKPGIALDITTDFMDDAALLAFLQANTINAFTYDDAPGRGISSCTDYALAAGRPIAISRSEMFRHLLVANPSIRVDERPLRDIAADGVTPLRHLRERFVPEAAGRAWASEIIGALNRRAVSRAAPDGRGFNKLLDDTARAAYTEALADLERLAPAMLERKIPRANIQQAFGLDTARRLLGQYEAPRILAIGSYEDTAVESLKRLGYRVTEIDPQVNGLDLGAFYQAHSYGRFYDLILCVSVLEHVEDDATFMRMVNELLAPEGVGIFTVDFSERYPETGRRPQADHRLFTSADLLQRLQAELSGCVLYDRPAWDKGVDDFEYEGCTYAFAAWVFRKLPIDGRDALIAREGATRRLDRLGPRAPASGQAAGRAAGSGEPPAAVRPGGIARRIVRGVFRRLVVPLTRPVAARLRAYLTAQVHQDLLDLRQDLASLRADRGAYGPSIDEALITALLEGKVIDVSVRSAAATARLDPAAARDQPPA